MHNWNVYASPSGLPTFPFAQLALAYSYMCVIFQAEGGYYGTTPSGIQGTDGTRPLQILELFADDGPLSLQLVAWTRTKNSNMHRPPYMYCPAVASLVLLYPPIIRIARYIKTTIRQSVHDSKAKDMGQALFHLRAFVQSLCLLRNSSMVGPLPSMRGRRNGPWFGNLSLRTLREDLSVNDGRRSGHIYIYIYV